MLYDNNGLRIVPHPGQQKIPLLRTLIQLIHFRKVFWEFSMKHLASLLFIFTLLAFGHVHAQEAPVPSSDQESTAIPELNEHILRIIRQYPTDGTHKYSWTGGYDGGTKDMFLAGEKVMRGNSNADTYCCGLTLEVFLKTYKDWLQDSGIEESSAPLSAADWKEFKRLWFVVDLSGPGPSAALEEYEIGESIDPKEAVPGDFLQIWRTPNNKGKVSGHSVIFLDWVRSEDSGKPIGIRYWSTQTSTNGIGENVEYFGPFGGMSTDTTYFSRLQLPSNAQVTQETNEAVEKKESSES